MIERLLTETMIITLLNVEDSNSNMQMFAKQCKLSYPTTSVQLAKLERCGLIISYKKKNRIYFDLSLSGKAVRDMLRRLESEVVMSKNEYDRSMLKEIQKQIR